MNRIRLLSIAALALLSAGLIAACGSSGGSEDPQQVIDQTFSGDHTVKSGNLDLAVKASAQGSQSGSFSASLSGPFQGGASNTFPQFDLTGKLDASGAGQNINFSGGLISTGDAAYVSYNGTDYSVPATIFDQFKQSYLKGQKSQSQSQTAGLSPSEAFTQGCSQSLEQQGSSKSTAQSACTIDFKGLLTNLSNDGDADVEGTTTTHISGDIDVQAAANDFAKLIKATPQGQQLPQSAIDQITSKATDAVDTASFDLYSGNDDHTLRKLDFTLKISPPAGSTSSGVSSVSLNFSLTLSHLGETQTIKAPTNAKPLSDLSSQLGGLGALGGLGGASGGTTSPTLPGGSSGGGTGSGSQPSAAQSQAYLKCLQQAGSSSAAIQACASKIK